MVVPQAVSLGARYSNCDLERISWSHVVVDLEMLSPHSVIPLEPSKPVVCILWDEIQSDAVVFCPGSKLMAHVRATHVQAQYVHRSCPVQPLVINDVQLACCRSLSDPLINLISAVLVQQSKDFAWGASPLDLEHVGVHQLIETFCRGQ